VEEGSKVWSGSWYDDAGLAQNGFEGELIDAFANKSSCPVSTIKVTFKVWDVFT
jgi:hypothetical protein